jgi:hypothetical protein
MDIAFPKKALSWRIKVMLPWECGDCLSYGIIIPGITLPGETMRPQRRSGKTAPGSTGEAAGGTYPEALDSAQSPFPIRRNDAQ